jgi:CelD/BcsL family acetyltransferase involved in cellulose biosynthesis
VPDTQLAVVAVPTLAVPNGNHQREPAPSSQLSVEHVRSLSQLRDRVPAWQELHARSDNPNPFTDPLWLVAWAEHFTAGAELDVLFVHGGGQLLGAAPFYRPRHPASELFGVKRWLLFGSAGKENLTELTEPLVVPGRRRAVLRAIVSEMTTRPDMDWMELPLSADQGWLETQWWRMDGKHPRFVAVHKGTVASVVMDLRPGDSAPPLKRNLRRGLRHRRNQLERQGASVAIERLDQPDQIAEGLCLLTRLHALRSAMTGVPQHPDVLRTDRAQTFLVDAATAMSRAGHAVIFVLKINGVPAAAQLVLIANGSYYLGLSGIDPERWDSSPLTLLTAAILDDAGAHNARRVNLSTGPNTAKLAWSENIECHQHFLIVRRSRISTARFSAYWQARCLERYWHEYRHQRRLSE